MLSFLEEAAEAVIRKLEHGKLSNQNVLLVEFLHTSVLTRELISEEIFALQPADYTDELNNLPAGLVNLARETELDAARGRPRRTRAQRPPAQPAQQRPPRRQDQQEQQPSPSELSDDGLMSLLNSLQSQGLLRLDDPNALNEIRQSPAFDALQELVLREFPLLGRRSNRSREGDENSHAVVLSDDDEDQNDEDYDGDDLIEALEDYFADDM